MKWANENYFNGLLIDFRYEENNDKLIDLGFKAIGYIDDNYGYIYALSDLMMSEDDLDFFR